MRFESRKISLAILAVTAIACSRVIFALLDDPEGPNLLVVLAMAAVICALTSAFYLSKFSPSLTGLKRTLVAVLVQILIAIGFYIVLR